MGPLGHPFVNRFLPRFGLVIAVLSAFPALVAAQSLPTEYWNSPLAAQRAAPSHWTPVERSLRPQDCGSCHADKFAEWQTSLHSKAFSPGLVGQLLTFNAQDTQGCMECHAPLAEQADAFENARREGHAEQAREQGLAAAGNSCAGCHLRGNRRFGPPDKATGAVGPSDATAPHGGVFRTKDFEDSGFCAACHQFQQDRAINGKPLENTVAEWQASPAAAEGKSCQSCHMPERRHLWRGIHDPEMVKAGLTAEFSAGPQAAVFSLTSTAIGHAFPTYVTPKATMMAVALDASGLPISGSEVSHVIQRSVESVKGDWQERSDTRLQAGDNVAIAIPWPVSGRVSMWLEVEPDAYYRTEVYAPLMRQLPKNGPAHRLITEADARAKGNGYRLFETELRRPWEK